MNSKFNNRNNQNQQQNQNQDLRPHPPGRHPGSEPGQTGLLRIHCRISQKPEKCHSGAASEAS